MHQDTNNPTLTPQQIIDSYQRAYRQVHGQEPHVTHLFAEWYQVQGETVHRVTLFGEISRLRGLTQHQRTITTDKTLVQRLIARLRRI